MAFTSKLFCLLACLVLANAANFQIDVDYYQTYPVSTYLQVGDSVTWFCTSTVQQHFIGRIAQDFSGGFDTTKPGAFVPFSGPGGGNGNTFTYTYVFTAADQAYEGQGFYWGDFFNPASAAFGIVHIARATDVRIEFDLFANPAFPAGSNPPFALDTNYPLNTTVAPGTRVIWSDLDETLISHMISIGDGKNYRAACLTRPWSHTFAFTRRSLFWAWTFDTVGKYSWNCLIHPNEFGFVSVCDGPNGNHCGTWQKCENPYGDGNNDD